MTSCPVMPGEENDKCLSRCYQSKCVEGFVGRFASTKHSLAGGRVSRVVTYGGGGVASNAGNEQYFGRRASSEF